MAHNVQYILNFATKNAEKIDKVAGQTDRLEKKISSVGSAAKKIGGILAGAFAFNKIRSFVNEATIANNMQAEAIGKLGQVMSNTMNATDGQIQSILDLASAQQKLGVIGDEVQLSGAQELSTYLSKTASLEKLMPVMNDMLAQQYGLNASQEQAINIASMMGKVMDGQVGALTRYGYKFDDAQEKILKYGTEAQRAATLADVVSGSVGGVNKALAATPEGKLKQQANEMGDIKEQYGKAFTSIKTAIIPLRQQLMGTFSNVATWLENNGQTIAAVVGGIAATVIGAFGLIGDAISILYGIVTTIAQPFIFFFTSVKAGEPWAIALAVAIGAVTAAMTIGYIISKKQLILNKLGVVWLNVLILKETLLGKAVAIKNKLMLASPWGLAAAGIAGLVTLAVKLAGSFNKLGKAQKNISEKAASIYADEKLQLEKLHKQLEKTNPKSAERNKLVDELKQLYPDINKGLEDELRNTNDLTGAYTKLANEAKRSAYERAKAALLDEKAADLVKLQFERERLLAEGADQSWLGSAFNDKSGRAVWKALEIAELQKEIDQISNLNIVAGVVLDKTKLVEQLKPLQQLLPFNLAAFMQPTPWLDTPKRKDGGGSDVKTGTESIVTGGTKSTNITISIGKMVETMTFSSSNQQQNVQDMEAQVLDAMLRAINMSQAAAI